jgi:hypothetical protein
MRKCTAVFSQKVDKKYNFRNLRVNKMDILRQIFKKQSGSVLIRFTLYKMG